MKEKHNEFMDKLTDLCREYDAIIEANTVGDLMIVTFNVSNCLDKKKISYYFGDFIGANTKIGNKNK